MFSLKILNFLQILIFFTYVTFLALFSSSELPTQVNHGNFMPYLADKPISEDGFYMLTVAWNFGQGKGFEYNQGLKTSGVQPLATVAFGILGFVSSKVGITKKDFPRIIILFSALILFVFTIVLKNTLLSFFNEFDKDIILFLCIIFGMLNFDLFISFKNGLETGVYILMILISIGMYWKLVNEQSTRNIILTGIIFGLTALTRIDFIIFSTVFLTFGLLLSKIKFKVAVPVQILQLLMISPWLLYTFNLTGSIIQSSALSQLEYISIPDSLNRLFFVLLAFFESITPNIFTGNHHYILIVLGFTVLVLLSVLLFKRRKILENLKVLYLILLFVSILLIIMYASISGASHFYTRYFSPLIMFTVLLIIPLVYDLIKKNSFKLLFFISLFFISIFFIQAYLYFHPQKLGVILAIRPVFIIKNFGENQLVGSYSSGVTGYYCSNVVNLDGKINHTALHYSRNNQLIDYIDSMKIIGLIEWEFFFPVGNGDQFNRNWKNFQIILVIIERCVSKDAIKYF